MPSMSTLLSPEYHGFEWVANRWDDAQLLAKTDMRISVVFKYPYLYIERSRAQPDRRKCLAPAAIASPVIKPCRFSHESSILWAFSAYEPGTGLQTLILLLLTHLVHSPGLKSGPTSVLW